MMRTLSTTDKPDDVPDQVEKAPQQVDGEQVHKTKKREPRAKGDR